MWDALMSVKILKKRADKTLTARPRQSLSTLAPLAQLATRLLMFRRPLRLSVPSPSLTARASLTVRCRCSLPASPTRPPLLLLLEQLQLAEPLLRAQTVRLRAGVALPAVVVGVAVVQAVALEVDVP